MSTTTANVDFTPKDFLAAAAAGVAALELTQELANHAVPAAAEMVNRGGGR